MDMVLYILVSAGGWLIGLPWLMTTCAQRWGHEPPCTPREAWDSVGSSVLLVAAFSLVIPFMGCDGWDWPRVIAWSRMPGVWGLGLVGCGFLAWRWARQSRTLVLIWEVSLCVAWLSYAPGPCCRGDFAPTECLPLTRSL